MRKPLAFLVVLAAACGGKKSSGPGQDWSGKPLDQKIEAKVNNVAFSLMVPKGMRAEEGGDTSPEAITRSWEADLEDQWSEPHFAVSYASIPAKDLDGFLEDRMLDDDEVIVKKEATADGFVVTHHSKTKGLVYAEVMKIKGEHHLECRASQAKDGGVPSFDKTIAWLEKLCSSLTIE